jgi:hypothetical protein
VRAGFDAFGAQATTDKRVRASFREEIRIIF